MTSKTKIKVLRIKSRLTVGGPDIHVLLLNSGLNKEAFESYLAVGVAGNGEPDMTSTAEDMDISVFSIPELKREINLWVDFIAFIKICGLIRRIKPDIVHTHTAKAGTLGRLAAIVNRVPVKVHTYHGHIFHSYFGKHRTRFIIFLERFLARFTNGIVVISKNQLRDVKDVYRIAPSQKCPLIPLGLDLEPFLNNAARDTGEGEGGADRVLSVGIIGRLVDVKNHKMFIDVAREVKSKAPCLRVKFIIVGDGSLRADLESYAASLGLSGSVVFKGLLPDLTGDRKDLVDLYRDLDIVALTSLNEGTPISLIEAMASGKAVVSTDVGGVRDVVVHGQTGLLSPSGDVAHFTANVISLLEDGVRRAEMGKRGKEFVAERFSKERLFKDIEDLYRMLLKERNEEEVAV